jgi:GntR family transcriptional regulator, transcriptional repressor for pyruvate dehydrogenase complex
MPTFKPILRKKASEQVAEQIRKSILRGRLTPGQRLPSERDLASQFEVTRTTLREALKKLEGLRLIFIRHGDRATVLDWMRHGSLDLLGDLVSRKDRLNVALLANLMEARVVVGVAVAQLAARRRTEDDLLNLEEGLEAMEHSTGDTRQFQAAEFDFFHALATTAHNLVFVFLLNSIRKIYLANAAWFEPLVGDREATVLNHRRVLEAVRGQDGEAAARISRAFLEEGMQRVLAAQEERAEAGDPGTLDDD